MCRKMLSSTSLFKFNTSLLGPLSLISKCRKIVTIRSRSGNKQPTAGQNMLDSQHTLLNALTSHDKVTVASFDFPQQYPYSFSFELSPIFFSLNISFLCHNLILPITPTFPSCASTTSPSEWSPHIHKSWVPFAQPYMPLRRIRTICWRLHPQSKSGKCGARRNKMGRLADSDPELKFPLVKSLKWLEHLYVPNLMKDSDVWSVLSIGLDWFTNRCSSNSTIFAWNSPAASITCEILLCKLYDMTWCDFRVLLVIHLGCNPLVSNEWHTLSRKCLLCRCRIDWNF